MKRPIRTIINNISHNHICRYCGKKYECSEEHDYFENSDYDCRWYTIATCKECLAKEKL